MSSGHINEVRTRGLDDPSLSRDTRPLTEGRARDVFPRVSFARASSRAPSRPASGSRPRRKCLNPKNLKREACLRSIVFVFPRPELTPPLPRPLLSADPPPQVLREPPGYQEAQAVHPPQEEGGQAAHRGAGARGEGAGGAQPRRPPHGWGFPPRRQLSGAAPPRRARIAGLVVFSSLIRRGRHISSAPPRLVKL